MTDPVTLGVAAVALAVALAAGWYIVPAPPDLDGERWFKVQLATLLRGQVEREGGDAVAWEGRVLRFVPYHPAGRLPEKKVGDPKGWAAPGLSLPGEAGLVEALAEIGEPAARWARLYADEVAIEARLADPADLGEDYDPGRWLGPTASWDAVANWGAGQDESFAQTLRRRVPARWVLVEGPADGPNVPPVMLALSGVLGESCVVMPFPVGEPKEAAATLQQALEAVVPEVSDRLVIVAEREAAHLALRALAEAPTVRDRMVAFVAVGGVVAGREGDAGPYGRAVLEDWMGHWFTPENLDTEVNRATPYLHLGWYAPNVSPPGVEGLPIAATRFPAVDPGALSHIVPVDLGVLPADPDLPVEQVARALWSVTALWVLAADG